MKLSNKTYDTLKFVALLIAPIVTLVASVVDIWGIPHGTEIVATLAAVDVFIGAVVTIAKAAWDKENKE